MGIVKFFKASNLKLFILKNFLSYFFDVVLFCLDNSNKNLSVFLFILRPRKFRGSPTTSSAVLVVNNP